MEKPRRDLFAPILDCEPMMATLLLIGRLLIAGIFVFYIYRELEMIHNPGLLLYATILAEFAGLVLVVLGYQTRFAAFLLIACFAVIFQEFRPMMQLTSNLSTIAEKAAAVTGGLLVLYVHGPGRLSIDRMQGGGNPLPASNTGSLLLFSRVLMVFVFYFFGISKILNLNEIKAFMVRHNAHVPTDLVWLAIVIQLAAPTLVLLGYKTRWGAFFLGGFCIVAPVLFHNAFGDPGEVEHFLLDMAITGSYLFLFSHGPGPLSIDASESVPAEAALPLGA